MTAAAGRAVVVVGRPDVDVDVVVVAGCVVVVVVDVVDVDVVVVVVVVGVVGAAVHVGLAGPAAGAPVGSSNRW